MHFFNTAKKICHTRIRPTHRSEKIFSMDSFRSRLLCDKGTRWTT